MTVLTAVNRWPSGKRTEPQPLQSWRESNICRVFNVVFSLPLPLPLHIYIYIYIYIPHYNTFHTCCGDSKGLSHRTIFTNQLRGYSCSRAIQISMNSSYSFDETSKWLQHPCSLRWPRLSLSLFHVWIGVKNSPLALHYLHTERVDIECVLSHSLWQSDYYASND